MRPRHCYRLGHDHPFLTDRQLRDMLGYIWAKGGQDIRLDVLPNYVFNPLLAMPIQCPLTPAECAAKLRMEQEDRFFHQLTTPPKPRAKSIDQLASRSTGHLCLLSTSQYPPPHSNVLGPEN